MQSHVLNDFMTEPLNFFFQMQLTAPELGKHLVIGQAMEKSLFDLFFETFKIGNTGWLCHRSLQFRA